MRLQAADKADAINAVADRDKAEATAAAAVRTEEHASFLDDIRVEKSNGAGSEKTPTESLKQNSSTKAIRTTTTSKGSVAGGIDSFLVAERSRGMKPIWPVTA